jgi:hypothetical protein
MKKIFTVTFFLGACVLFILSSVLQGSGGTVIGNIDGVVNGPYYPRHHLNGWACITGSPSSIAVHVYAGGPAGVGHFVTAVTANLPSDQAVANACQSNGTAYRFSIALDDFLPANFGQSIYVHGIGGSNPLLSFSGSYAFPDGFTVNVFNYPMRIRTPSTLGGSIGSLTWKGKEFVNTSDHGREFQVAAKFNYYGECYNPTEAGSLSDGAGTSPSTSQVYTYSIPAPNQLFTGSFPAFWLHYDETSPYCVPYSGPPGQNGGNQNPRSDFNFYKTVTAGHVLENVIKVDTWMYIPYAVTQAEVESFTGLMNNSDFPRIMKYDVVSGTATVAKGETFVNTPLIFASLDNEYALGIYNRQLSPQNNPNLTVGHYRWNRVPEYSVNAWSSVFNFGVTSGPYNWYFTNYLIIGTYQQVLTTMGTVHSAPASFP